MSRVELKKETFWVWDYDFRRIKLKFYHESIYKFIGFEGLK